jgi:hypothetical protein
MNQDAVHAARVGDDVVFAMMGDDTGAITRYTGPIWRRGRREDRFAGLVSRQEDDDASVAAVGAADFGALVADGMATRRRVFANGSLERVRPFERPVADLKVIEGRTYVRRANRSQETLSLVRRDGSVFAQADDGSFWTPETARLDGHAVRWGRSLLDAPLTELARRPDASDRPSLVSDLVAERPLPAADTTLPGPEAPWRTDPFDSAGNPTDSGLPGGVGPRRIHFGGARGHASPRKTLSRLESRVE